MSAPARALAELRGFATLEERQRQLRDEYVALLQARPDALLRTCYPAHLTAGALVLSDSADAVLLNLHGKARRWFHFGGHVEASDPSLRAAALREAVEESGLSGLRLWPEPVQLSRHTVPFCDPRGPVDHLDVRYAAIAPPDARVRVSEESLDVRWWPLDGLPELDPDLHELIARARERAQAPEPPRSSLAPVE